MTLRACGCSTSPSERLSWKASQWVSLCHGLGACEELRAQTEEAQASTNSHFFNRSQTCQLYFSIIHLLFIKGKKEYNCNDKTANKRVFKVRKLLKSLNFSMIIFPKNNTADLMHTDLIAGHVVTQYLDSLLLLLSETILIIEIKNKYKMVKLKLTYNYLKLNIKTTKTLVKMSKSKLKYKNER